MKRIDIYFWRDTSRVILDKYYKDYKDGMLDFESSEHARHRKVVEWIEERMKKCCIGQPCSRCGIRNESVVYYNEYNLEMFCEPCTDIVAVDAYGEPQHEEFEPRGSEASFNHAEKVMERDRDKERGC